MPYAYLVTATDPAGGTVAFSLTASPAGATLAGGALSWTPAAAQSRVSNMFTVTATTTSGGTATQSWTVTPSGTITVNLINTFWTASGPQQIAGSFSVGAAVVPNEDGSVIVIAGSFTAPGVFSITGVPAGYFWLTTGINLTNIFDAFWTSSSTIDLGKDIPGAQTALTTEQNTTFNFDIGGLDPLAAPGPVAVSTPTFLMSPATEATSVSGTTTVDSETDWSKVDTVFLLQYGSSSTQPLNFWALGPALIVSNPGYTNGGTNTLTGTLQASPQASLNLSVPGSEWASLFKNVGPSVAQDAGSWFSVSAEPFITGRNQSPNLLAQGLPLVTASVGVTGPSVLFPNFCLNGTEPGGSITDEPPIVNDENFGTVNYGDQFPDSWTRAVAFCQDAEVQLSVAGSPGTSFPMVLPFGVAVAPSSSPSLAPLAEPVLNPTVNGANLFMESTSNSTAVTLSWSAPQGTAPFGYRIAVLAQTPIANGVQYAVAGEFGTAKTSATLPPLTAGQAYVFVITTAVDAAANMETSPWRSALPTGFANVISAPVTISSSATTPAIHGNAKVFADLFRHQGKIVASSAATQPKPASR
jgi:hypothetical protein